MSLRQAMARRGGAAFVRERPDIVLTDLSMPVLDGFALLELVRRASPETPIIVVSGWGGKRDAIDAIRKGAWDYIFKPVTDAAELEIVIGRALERAGYLSAQRSYHEQLEERVAERTRELQESEARLTESLEHVRSLSIHLETIREEERAQIAREVHDELGQILTVIGFDLQWLKSRMPERAAESLHKIDQMHAHIKAAMVSVRKIAQQLHPSLLQDLGLVAAMEAHGEDFAKRTGTACRFRFEGSLDKVTGVLAQTIFRIFQEALTNVARHAKASVVEVSLCEREGLTVLEITDNGKGITEEQRNSRQTFGLMGMRERARMCGGNVEITGEPGRGTTIRASFRTNWGNVVKTPVKAGRR